MSFDLSTYRQDHLARKRRLMGVPQRQSAPQVVAAVRDDPRPQVAYLKAKALTEALRTIEHPVSRIIRETAERRGLSIGDITGPSRKVHLVRARQEAMAEAFQLGRYSFPEIGRRFNRDHTTVMHACRKLGVNPPTAVAGSVDEQETPEAAIRAAIYTAIRSGHWMTTLEVYRHVKSRLGRCPRQGILDRAWLAVRQVQGASLEVAEWGGFRLRRKKRSPSRQSEH